MANRIVVDFNSLERISRKLMEAGNDIEEAASILGAVRPTQANGAYTRLNGLSISFRSIGGSVSASNAAQVAVNYRSAARRLSAYSQSLSAAVRQTAARFRETENGTVGSAEGQKFPKDMPNLGDVIESVSKPSFQWKFSDWMKLLGSAGIIGAGASGVISLARDIMTGGFTAKSVLSFLKSGAKVTEKVAGGFSKCSFDWFGLNAAEGGRKTFAEALGDELGKYKWGDGAKTCDKIKVAAKWAGSILTVATTAYDNFTDTTENNSFGRKVAETIGESVVKIGGGMLIGSVVGTVLSTVGAPALVVGGVTVVATWAINKTFEALTGKDAAEAISDFVLDNASAAAKKVTDAVGETVKKVGSAAKKAGKAISGWWDSLCGRPRYAGA